MEKKFSESVGSFWFDFLSEVDLYVKTPMRSALRHLDNEYVKNAELSEKLLLNSLEQLDRILEKSSTAIKELN